MALSLRTIHLFSGRFGRAEGAPPRPVAPLLSSGKYDGDLEQLTVAAAGGGRRRGME